MPTPVSVTSIRAPSSVGTTATRTEPPRGVNLIALPTRFATTWPMRGGSWRMRIGASGRSTVTRTPRRAAAESCWWAADSTAARRSSGRRSSRTRPESSFESSSRFWASQSSRSICPALDSRNSARASGSSPGRLHQQLVERAQRRERGPQLVRDVGEEVAAPIAVAPADLDALLEAVGHRVELDGQLAELRGSGAQLGGRHAPREVALGQRPGGVGELAQWRREAARQRGRHDDREAEREQGDRREEAREVRDGRGPEGRWIGQRDLERVALEGLAAAVALRHERVPRATGRLAGEPAGSSGTCRWARG